MAIAGVLAFASLSSQKRLQNSIASLCKDFHQETNQRNRFQVPLYRQPQSTAGGTEEAPEGAEYGITGSNVVPFSVRYRGFQ